MPDFEVTVAGATVEQWLDPAIAGAPSRLNPLPGRPSARLIGTVGVAISLTAVVAGVSAPLDSALGGRLFVCSSVESPLPYPVAFTIPTSGKSSVQEFTPSMAGHYLVCMRRPTGGAWFLHVDALEGD